MVHDEGQTPMVAKAMSRVRALCVLALAAASLVTGCSDRESNPDANAEKRARAVFARSIAIDSGAGRGLAVASRDDVVFEEGFSPISYDPPDDFRNAAFRWLGQRGHVRLRGHGDRAMSLKVTGWVNETVIRSKPVVTLYLRGHRIYDTGAVENGGWAADAIVPATMLDGFAWSDLLVTVSAVGFHWAEPQQGVAKPTDLKVVVLNSLEWRQVL